MGEARADVDLPSRNKRARTARQLAEDAGLAGAVALLSGSTAAAAPPAAATVESDKVSPMDQKLSVATEQLKGTVAGAPPAAAGARGEGAVEPAKALADDAAASAPREA